MALNRIYIENKQKIYKLILSKIISYLKKRIELPETSTSDSGKDEAK